MDHRNRSGTTAVSRAKSRGIPLSNILPFSSRYVISHIRISLYLHFLIPLLHSIIIIHIKVAANDQYAGKDALQKATSVRNEALREQSPAIVISEIVTGETAAAPPAPTTAAATTAAAAATAATATACEERQEGPAHTSP